jgi:hypothetical protein
MLPRPLRERVAGELGQVWIDQNQLRRNQRLEVGCYASAPAGGYGACATCLRAVERCPERSPPVERPL